MLYINLLIKPASSLCNMRCRYCFYADEAANRELPSMGVMTVSTAETMIARAAPRLREIAEAEKKSDAAIIENDRRRGGVDRF